MRGELKIQEADCVNSGGKRNGLVQLRDGGVDGSQFANDRQAGVESFEQFHGINISAIWRRSMRVFESLEKLKRLARNCSRVGRVANKLPPMKWNFDVTQAAAAIRFGRFRQP
jgi:hypothetical protein